jgi:hypothetical protein
MTKILVFLALLILLLGCEHEILHPDIEAVSISPRGYYIIDAVRVVPVDTVTLVPKNSQDSHVTGFYWEFYDFEDNLIYRAAEPFPLSVAIPGLVDPTCACTTYIYDLIVQTDTLSAYLLHNNLYSAKIKYNFIAESDLFPGREDTADIYLGLYRLQVIYILSLSSDEDSIPRDGTSTTRITAKAGDFSGNPILGALLDFSTTLGTLEPPIMITNSEGEASVYLRSDQGSQTATATVTVSHPYASWPLSISVKFYAP